MSFPQYSHGVFTQDQVFPLFHGVEFFKDKLRFWLDSFENVLLLAHDLLQYFPLPNEPSCSILHLIHFIHINMFELVFYEWFILYGRWGSNPQSPPWKGGGVTNLPTTTYIWAEDEIWTRNQQLGRLWLYHWVTSALCTCGGTWTPMLSHQCLKLACLPIPPHRHFLAVRVGFEPTDAFRRLSFSRRVH